MNNISNKESSLNRFEKSCIRSFFTLPQNLREKPNSKSFLLKDQKLKSIPNISEINSINKDGIKYYIIWLSNPHDLNPGDSLDLSFRDFSYYEIIPYVLIRKSPLKKGNVL